MVTPLGGFNHPMALENSTTYSQSFPTQAGTKQKCICIRATKVNQLNYLEPARSTRFIKHDYAI